MTRARRSASCGSLFWPLTTCPGCLGSSCMHHRCLAASLPLKALPPSYGQGTREEARRRVMKSASTCSFATLGGFSRTSPSGKNETLAINLENVRYRRGRSPRDQCSGCPLTRPVLPKCPVLGTADISGPSKDVCWCQNHAASHVQLDESTLGVGDGGAATQEMHSGVP